MSKRINWILIFVVACAILGNSGYAQEGLKEAQKLLEKKQWAKAQDAFDTLLEDHGDVFAVRMGMAQAAYWNNDPGTGGFNAVRALNMKPDSALAAEYVGRCFLAQGHQKRGNQKDPTGLYEQAAEAFEKAIAGSKNKAPLYLESGHCYYWLNQQEKATKMYAAALAHKLSAKFEGQAVNALWRYYSQSKNWDGMVKDLDGWLKAKPNNDVALWWKGYVLNLQQNYAEAMKTWKKLEQVSARYRPEAIYFQGVAANGMGKLDEAIALFSKAGSMRYGWTDQKHPGLSLHAIAGSLFGRGDLARACEIAEKYALPALHGERRVSLQSDLGLFYRDYGTSLERQKKNQAARKAYAKSKAFYADAVRDMVKYSKFSKPWRAQVQNDYALMYHYHFDDLNEALKNYKIALGYDETNTDACLNFGRIMKRRGKFREALRVAEKGKARGDLNILIASLKRELEK